MGQYLHYVFFRALLSHLTSPQDGSSILSEALLIYLSDLDLSIEFVPTVLHF